MSTVFCYRSQLKLKLNPISITMSTRSTSSSSASSSSSPATPSSPSLSSSSTPSSPFLSPLTTPTRPSHHRRLSASSQATRQVDVEDDRADSALDSALDQEAVNALLAAGAVFSTRLYASSNVTETYNALQLFNGQPDMLLRVAAAMQIESQRQLSGAQLVDSLMIVHYHVLRGLASPLPGQFCSASPSDSSPMVTDQPINCPESMLQKWLQRARDKKQSIWVARQYRNHTVG